LVSKAINQSSNQLAIQNLFDFQSRQLSNQLANGACLISKAGKQAINLLSVPV
jgi:hypothetical protein